MFVDKLKDSHFEIKIKIKIKNNLKKRGIIKTIVKKISNWN